MSEARLPAALEVAAIRRQVETAGGHAMVLRSGDPDRGSLILAISQKGVPQALLERMLEVGGDYRWERAGPPTGDLAEVAQFLAKRTRIDPDTWLIELDVPDAERFIAEMRSSG